MLDSYTEALITIVGGGRGKLAPFLLEKSYFLIYLESAKWVETTAGRSEKRPSPDSAIPGSSVPIILSESSFRSAVKAFVTRQVEFWKEGWRNALQECPMVRGMNGG
ncbi:hypothetical protein KM043_001637 [Ampulex compressa]|nr:hypothetical protein KM043_001637 [Ampulex compressa]